MKKIYKISIGVVVALLLIVALSINSIIKTILIDTARERTGLDVSIGSLWLNPFSGRISSKDIVVKESDREIFTLKSFLLESSPLDLMKGNLYIDAVTLKEPVIDISSREVEDKKISEEKPSEATTPSEKKETPAPSEESVTQKEESFIKEIVVKNINVENLTLKGKDTILKSLNTFSLKVPDFTMKGDDLILKANLDIAGTGILDLDLSAQTDTGDLHMDLKSASLAINNSLDSKLGLLILNGEFSGETSIQGNYKNKTFTLKGNGDFRDFKVSDPEDNTLIAMDNFKVDITEAKYPHMSADASGSYTITGGESLLPFLLKDKEGISASLSQALVTGSFTLDYPVLTTSPVVKTDGLKVDLENGSTLTSDNLQGEYSLHYDIDSKEYTVTGDTTSTGTRYTSSDTSFSGDLDILLDHIKPEDIRIKEFSLKGGEASFSGEKLSNLSLSLKNFTTETLDSPLKVSGSFTGAPFSGDLHLISKDIKDISGLSLKGDISLKGLNLDSVKKYTETLPYDLGGIVSYDGYLDYSEDHIATRGSFSSTGFSVREEGSLDIRTNTLSGDIDLSKTGEKLVLKNSTLDFTGLSGSPAQGIQVSLPKGRFALTSYKPDDIVLSLTSLTSPDVEIVTTENTQVALVPLQEKSISLPLIEKVAYAQEVKAAAPEAKKPLPNISVKDLRVSGGKLTYTKDGDPLVISSINLKSSDFTTKKGKPFTLDASASLEGMDSLYIKGSSTLRKDWDFDPKSISFKGDLGIKNLYLPDFNDKFANSLPNKIQRGIVNSSGNLALDSGKIASRSRLIISDLELGQATGVASRIPLDRVVDALKDDKGDINITVPVEGDLNDPNFGVEKVVLEILMTNFTEVLKTPEKAVSSIISIGSSDKENVVYFDYLESTPKADDLPKLDEFIAMLKEDPSSKLRVTIFTNDKVEKGLMKTQDIAGILFGNKKSSSSDDLDEIMADRKKYIYDYVTAHVDGSRVEILISNRDKSLPQAKLEIVK